MRQLKEAREQLDKYQSILARSAHADFTVPPAESPDRPGFTEQTSSANGEFSDSLMSGVCFSVDMGDSTHANQYMLDNIVLTRANAAELFME